MKLIKILTIMIFLLIIPIAYADFNEGLVHYFAFENTTSDLVGNWVMDFPESFINAKHVKGMAATSGTDSEIAGKQGFHNGTFTANIWINATDNTAATQYGYHQWTNTGGDSGRALQMVSSSIYQAKCIMRQADNTQKITAPVAYTAKEWVMITCVGNGTDIAIWKNGVLQSAVATTGFKEVANELEFGHAAGGSDFTGVFDEFSLYNRSLSPSEIVSLYNSGAGRFAPYVSATAPVLSSYNITSSNVLSDSNRTAWNTGKQAQIRSNLLTGTFSTDINANCSVSLQNLNYTGMVAYDLDYKLATTETTSHSFLLKDNLTLGEQCVYASCIGTEDGLEGAASSSGCLNLSLINDYTSLRGRDLGGSDFSFLSTSYITGFRTYFNTTLESSYILFSSFNVEKLAPGVDLTNIYARIKLDDTVIKEELIRSVSTTGSQGSTGLFPINFSVGTGQHNITVDFRSDKLHLINVSNIDFVLLNLVSTGLEEGLSFDIDKGVKTISGSAYYNVFNHSHVNTVISPNYAIINYRVLGSNGVFSSYMTDSSTSPYTSRSLSGGYGSGIYSFLEPVEHSESNFRVYAKETATTTIELNYSLFHMSMRDTSGRLVYGFSSSNATSSELTPITVSAGKVKLTNISYNDNGEGIGIVAYASVTDSNENVILSVENDNGSCVILKERGFGASSATGVVYLYGICEETIGNMSLYIQSSGGTVVVDEGLEVFSIDLINITSGFVPPLKNLIIYPLNESSNWGVGTINWTAFSDPNGDLDYYNVTLRNLDGSLNSTIGNVSSEFLSIVVNWSFYDPDDYKLQVEGVDEQGLTDNATLDFITVDNMTINVELITPANNSVQNYGWVVFSFNTSMVSNCSLFLNGSINQSINAVPYTNSFSNLTLNDSTYYWKVYCVNNEGSWGESGIFLFEIDIPEPILSAFNIANCPIDSTAQSIVFFVLVLVTLFFIAFGFMGFGFSGMIGGIMLVVLSWYSAACIGLLAFAMAILGLFLIVYFPVKSLF